MGSRRSTPKISFWPCKLLRRRWAETERQEEAAIPLNSARFDLDREHAEPDPPAADMQPLAAIAIRTGEGLRRRREVLGVPVGLKADQVGREHVPDQAGGVGAADKTSGAGNGMWRKKPIGFRRFRARSKAGIASR